MLIYIPIEQKQILINCNAQVAMQNEQKRRETQGILRGVLDRYFFFMRS